MSFRLPSPGAPSRARVERGFAREIAAHLFRGRFCSAFDGFQRGAGDVRRQGYVVEPQQFEVGWNRFNREGLERRARPDFIAFRGSPCPCPER